MSAFICNDRHISILAHYAAHNLSLGATPAEIGAMLHRENVASVNHRYSESTVPAFVYDSTVESLKVEPVQIIKAAHCLDYQSCEHDAWDKSEARQLLLQIIENAAYKFPGYESAQWEISE